MWISNMLFKCVSGFVSTFLVFTAISQPSIASSGIISGNLISESGMPLTYASVGLIKLAGEDSLAVKGLLSDENGNFCFSGLSVGTYFIKVSMTGFVTRAIGPLIISQSQNIELNEVRMVTSNNQLNTVHVKSSKPTIERRPDKLIINIDGSILATGNSALEILERAPGVTVDNLGGISIKGRPGAQIMIDGRLANLNQEDLLNLLRSTNGSFIRSIEIISNPSSKYDAAGSSGIIDIKLKKNTDYGTNGVITAGAGYGDYYKVNGELTFNHRQKCFNFFGAYGYSDNKSTTDLVTYRESLFKDESTFFRRTGKAVDLTNNSTYRAGADYFINKNNVIGLVASGFSSTGEINSPNVTLIGSKQNSVDSLIQAQNYSDDMNSNLGINLNYRSTLDTSGMKLTVDLDYVRYDRRDSNRYNNFYELTSLLTKEPDIFRNITPSNVRIWSAKVDFEHPLSKRTKVEFGVKSSFVTTDNDFLFENLKSEGWQNDVDRTNHFKYKEKINAAYVTLTHSLSNTTLKYGLRTEYTNSNGHSITLKQISKRSYLDLFPSVFISHKIIEGNMLNFSYSRRIDRPDYASLNPFVEFIDLYTFERGNPFLNPQYADVAELTYTCKDIYNVTIGIGNTKDAMSTVLLSDDVSKTLYLTQENLGRRRYLDISLGAPIKLSSKWTSQNDLAFLYSTIESPNLYGLAFKERKFSFMFNTTQSRDLTPTVKAELSANYFSSRIYGTYEIRPMYSVNAGLSKSFYDGKANMKLSASDVFNTSDIEISSFKPFSPYNLHQKYETRIFRLSFSYRFGKKHVKGPSERIKGSSEEEGRVGSN